MPEKRVSRNFPVDFSMIADLGKVKKGTLNPTERKLRRRVLLRAMLGEFVATFLFIFVVTATALNMDGEGNTPGESAICEALNQGLVGAAVIYAFASISGAHFNPAVSFATWVTGKTSNRKFICYLIAQLSGCLLSQAVILGSFPHFFDKFQKIIVRPAPGIDIGHALAMEIILSFVLIFVIFTVAFSGVNTERLNVDGVETHNLTIYSTDSTSKGRAAPLVIGFTLGVLTLIGGSVSGGAFNPARAFATAVSSGVWTDHWVYWVGDFVGGALGAWVQIIFEKSRVAPPTPQKAQSIIPSSPQSEVEMNSPAHSDA